MNAKIKPRFKHHCQDCTCLGEVVVNGRGANLFVCGDTVIARFGDDPGDYEASHLSALTALSSIYLLAAFRLYLDARGEKPARSAALHLARPLKS
jgi:hypothetical protein